MAKELEALKNQKQDDFANRLTESPSMPGSAQDSPDHPLEQSGTAVLDETGLTQDYYQLDDFIIDKDLVIDIYKIFCAFYYSHFPILNPHISISALYESSPLLFWTIIAITTSRAILPSHQALNAPLKEPFLRRFQSEILSAPVPLHTIQAIAYLTMFPFPVRTQANDPSWLYSGVAVNAAMYMGLHRAKAAPSLRSIGVPSGSPRARANTWLGCFLASTALAKHVGVFSPIRGSADLATIEHFVRNFPVPPEFAYQVMVHHTLAKYFNTIVENSQENMSQSLVNIIDTELDGLKTRYPTPWTPRVEVANLTAKMLLYTTVIIRLQADRASREILMRKGLSAAVRIVYLMDRGLAYQSKEFPNVPPENLQGTLPKNYFRILILSTTFLLRFFVLNNQASPEEQELARNHVAIAQRFLNAASKDTQDERVRGAILFEILSRQKPIDLENSKLRVDDRMGASLVFDAVTAGHELRHQPTEIDESSPNTATKGLPKPPVPPVDMNGQDLNIYDPSMSGFDTLDFSLPEDLWGDSIWGMFDNIAPSVYPPYTAPEPTQGQLGYNFMYN
ncbi:Nn.00g068540.m01.CDS01 [Neocucurbitaria sp. VM-36]